MAKARRPRDRPRLNALVSWWHERRRGLRPDWWVSPDVEEATAEYLVRDASVIWQDHGREILRELEEERRALESSARTEYDRTGQLLVDVGLILAGRKWTGKSKSLSALADWFTFNNKPVGLAERLRQDLEGDWATGAVFYPEFSLSDQDTRAGVDSVYNESLANALKRLRTVGLEPLYQAAKWLEGRLPQSLLDASRIRTVRQSPLDLPAYAVHKAVSALHEPLGRLVYDAVLRHAKGLTDGQRDDLHEALDEALFAQLDDALRDRSEQLERLVDRQRNSLWPHTIALPLVLSMHGSGMAHFKDVAGIQRSMAWLEGLDEAWRAWLSLATPDKVVGREASLSELWFKTAFARTGSVRDRAVAAATATTFLLDRITTVYAAVVEAAKGGTVGGLPLLAPRLGDCQVKVIDDESKVVVAVSGRKGQPVPVKQSIMRMLKQGLRGPIEKTRNPNAATNFRRWFREHFQLPEGVDSDPLKLDAQAKNYAVRFSLSFFDPPLPIGDHQLPARARAHLRAEARCAQERQETDSLETDGTSRDAKEPVRQLFQEIFRRPPTDEELANFLQFARNRGFPIE